MIKMENFWRIFLKVFLVILVAPVQSFLHLPSSQRPPQHVPMLGNSPTFYSIPVLQQQRSQFSRSPREIEKTFQQDSRYLLPSSQDYSEGTSYPNGLSNYLQTLSEHTRMNHYNSPTAYFTGNQYQQQSSNQQHLRVIPPDVGPVYLNVNARRYVGVPGRVVPHVRVAAPASFAFGRSQTFRIPLTLRLRRPNYGLENDPSSSSPPEDEDLSGNGIEAPGQGPPSSQSENQKPTQESSGHNQKPLPSHQENLHEPPQTYPPNDSNPPPSHQKVIHKHISVHVPPDDMEEDDNQVTIVKPKMPGPDKHVNIIFIKAPTTEPKQKKTEVVLPEMPEQKTLIYVLVKRPDPANDGSIRVRGPPPTTPSKPQVFFVRYKHKDDKYSYAERNNTHHK